MHCTQLHTMGNLTQILFHFSVKNTRSYLAKLLFFHKMNKHVNKFPEHSTNKNISGIKTLMVKKSCFLFKNEINKSHYF